MVIAGMLAMATGCTGGASSHRPAVGSAVPAATSGRLGAGSAGSPVNGVLPSRVLDLREWMLTLPQAAQGSRDAAEIKQPQLSTYADANFAVNQAGDGVVFTARAGGATTAGSTYPRSELREMTGDGIRKASWSTDVGVNTMTVTEAVTALPPAKPQVVTAQIHDATNDVIEILADGRHPGGGGTIKLTVRYMGQVQPVHLDDAYLPGTRYTVTLSAASGQITVAFEGTTKLTIRTSRSGLYFKAGVYTQSNPAQGDAPTAAGQVVIYALEVSHRS
jgi:poly(beta-D-mannuronate) lyase